MTADPRDLKTILATPITAPVYTIEPIMEEGDRVITYAEWGSFKSLWAAHLGLALAAGISVGPFTVSKSRRVLYVDEEMNSKRADRRIHRLAAGMGLEVPDVPFYLVNKTGHHFDLAGTIALHKLCDKAKLCPGDLTMYDSIRRGIVGSEKEVEDVSDMWQHIEEGFKELSFLGLHHMLKPRNPNKPRTSTRHAASGSTDIMGGADQALSMIRSGDYATIRHEKGRDGESADYRIHFDFSKEGPQKTGPIVVSYAPVPVETAKPPSVYEQIAAKVKALPPGTVLQTGEICGMVSNPPTYIKTEIIPELLAAKLLSKAAHGTYKTPKAAKVEAPT